MTRDEETEQEQTERREKFLTISVSSVASYEVTKEALLQLTVATLASIVPLALTLMSLEELLKRLLGVVF